MKRQKFVRRLGMIGSWVATSPAGRVVELFDPANVEKARAAGWKVETIMEYLVSWSRPRRGW